MRYSLRPFPLCWVFRCVSGFGACLCLLLLCWLPLFGACSRRCGSCRPPEFRFGLRSPWCVCFFLDLGCLVCALLAPSVCLVLAVLLPRPGGVDLVLVVRKFDMECAAGCTRSPCTGCLGVFSSCVLGVLSFAGGSVPYLGSSWCLGLLRDIFCCSFTGCRCSAPAPDAAALAGLLSYAAVYGHLGVLASYWICGALCALLAPSVR